MAGSYIWAEPDKNQMVNINAEKVPNPVTAEEMSRRRPYTVTRMRKGEFVRETVDRYFEQARSDQDVLGARDKQGNYLDPGVPYFETSLDVLGANRRQQVLYSYERYQPMPTNHSTLPQHVEFMRRVAAWDLPIGFCDSYKSRDFWLNLVRDADWTGLGDPYFTTGFLEVPPVPSGIDKQTAIDKTAGTGAESLRKYYELRQQKGHEAAAQEAIYDRS